MRYINSRFTYLLTYLLDKAWSDRCADLARAVDRLDAVSSQDALILLRSSFIIIIIIIIIIIHNVSK